MTTVRALLELQAFDTGLDQLRHRRGHLPEGTEAKEAARAATDARDALADVDRTQASAEAELAAIEASTTEIDEATARLERQLRQVIAPREAEALQHELQLLAARRSAADERGLELLDELDRLVGERERCTEALRAATLRADETAARLGAVQEEIDAEMAEIANRRSHLADQTDPALLARYESLRAHLGGVGAARLEGSRCEGCHIDLSRSELEAVRAVPEDEPAECPSCGRLLVR